MSTAGNGISQRKGAFVPMKKILHIGNIANNAYVNAKLLNEHGYINHVACDDYYHFAGCPEWQDMPAGVAIADIGDQNYPNFWRLGDNKPASPRWFAQGPAFQILNYLYFLTKNDDNNAETAWNVLNYLKLKVILSKNTLSHHQIFSDYFFAIKCQEAGIDLSHFKELSAGQSSEMYRTMLFDWHKLIWQNDLPGQPLHFPLKRTHLEEVGSFNCSVRALTTSVPRHDHLAAVGLEEIEFPASDLSVERLARHPGSQAYASYLGLWHEVMSRYDHVIAYGPSAIIPYLAGFDNYIAYEHGTLRELPFDGTLQGELISAAYVNARAVLVTNTDYLTQEKQLPIARERLITIPHAFDERPLRAFRALNPPVPRDHVLFFAPARHDWVSQFKTMTKNNHFVIHAVGHLVKKGYRDFKIKFVNWGVDAQNSRDLISSLKLDEYFEWCEPLSKQMLWYEYIQASAVIDQFILPSISGVSFEALALGCRVITCDDGQSNRRAFGEQPPLLPANDIEGVQRAMAMVLDDPHDRAGKGQAAWNWTDMYHSARRIVTIQEQLFERLDSGH